MYIIHVTSHYTKKDVVFTWCNLNSGSATLHDGICLLHYSDVIMGAMASQITLVSIVYSTVCSDTDQGKHQIFAALAFVRGIHRWPANSPHKGPVTRKIFPFDDVIMENAFWSKTSSLLLYLVLWLLIYWFHLALEYLHTQIWSCAGHDYI